jgi:ribose 5-phosphate isomerase B
MHIAIGCDHRGVEVKDFIKGLLAEAGHTVRDCGVCTSEPVDYPDIAREVALSVARGECQQGVIICDTGIGVSIAANKVRGIRAALCCDAFMAGRARQHNDANVLCVGTALEPATLREIVTTYLAASFEGGRHQRRVEKIAAMEGLAPGEGTQSCHL